MDSMEQEFTEVRLACLDLALKACAQDVNRKSIIHTAHEFWRFVNALDDQSHIENLEGDLDWLSFEEEIANAGASNGVVSLVRSEVARRGAQRDRAIRYQKLGGAND